MSAKANERAPYYWIVFGVALILLGAYLGFTISLAWAAIGVGIGLLLCTSGLWLLKKGLAKKDSEPAVAYDDYLDQTCELNAEYFGPDNLTSRSLD